MKSLIILCHLRMNNKAVGHKNNQSYYLEIPKHVVSPFSYLQKQQKRNQQLLPNFYSELLFLKQSKHLFTLETNELFSKSPSN